MYVRRQFQLPVCRVPAGALFRSGRLRRRSNAQSVEGWTLDGDHERIFLPGIKRPRAVSRNYRNTNFTPTLK